MPPQTRKMGENLQDDGAPRHFARPARGPDSPEFELMQEEEWRTFQKIRILQKTKLMSIDISPLLTLPRSERIALIRALAESLETEESTPSLTDAQIRETQEIIRKIDAGEIQLSPWSEARARILKNG